MHIVVTLVEKDFLYGACALLNSLTNNGFDGKFVIGYRDREGMPAKALAALSKGLESKVEWVQLDTPIHFANYKPWFMQSVFDRNPEARKVTYMDPDIVFLAPFDWIETWSDGGPAVCADVNWMMPAEHPTRHEWLRLSGMTAQRELDLFFNVGFLSVRREDAGFLGLWKDLIKGVGSRYNPLDGKGDIADWRKGGRWMPFCSPNQDTLNLALMVWDGEVTTLGPDVMGFTAVGLLPHALGSDKPWQKKYVRDALLGLPPRQIDKVFWSDVAQRPIRTYTGLHIALRRASVAVAASIGRFYRRS
jgi:hypothetical protein